ncbi:hypothetical protein K2173_017100 [Erythroxylum novogranatense]|uniref:Zinc knuckle CX2CX4HX4C domain-containing protein n=1 Tax=Erythroxylum novogranatense TaxID=1862640 RepID=A0AAV8U8Z1_9ROSI|nr:hypothetical protein K2173_017100 [Erythroxylum novogranatense]
MLIHQWKEGENPADIEFTHTDVWVQFHGLPRGFASKMLARNIGNLMGMFLEYDSTQCRNSWINYMRVQVRINVTEPLMRRKSIRKQGGEPITITFSYERLPLICYVCGIIGHSETHCYKLLERSEGDIVREWPEDIQEEIRARNARRTMQWKRDLGNGSGVDYVAQYQGMKSAQSPAHHSRKIGNNFSFISKKSMFKSSSDLGVQLRHNCSTIGGSLIGKSEGAYPSYLVEGFRNCILDCNLIDIPLLGFGYTWQRGSNATELTLERIDRAFANEEWLAIFPFHRLHNLVSATSDHTPIKLVVARHFPAKRTRRFKFENACLTEEGFLDFISVFWTDHRELNLLPRLRK